MRRTSAITIVAILLVATSAAAIEPGEWRSETQMVDVQLPPSFPAAATEMMRGQMERVMSNSSCISQEDIDSAPEQMFQQTDGECQYSDFEMADGRLNATAQCRTPQGQMTMVMTGTYTDSEYDMEFVNTGDMGMGGMKMTFHTTGQRIGPCA